MDRYPRGRKPDALVGKGFESNLGGTGRLEPPPSNQFSLVLLKREGWFGTAYYLERRENKFPGYPYPGRIGLYGGGCKPNETRAQAAVREILEETKRNVGAASLASLLKFKGDNDNLTESEGEVFVHTWSSTWGSPSVGAIKTAIRNHRKQNFDKDDPRRPGRPVVLRHWFGLFFVFFGWKRLTPQAAYAVLADLDREAKQHAWEHADLHDEESATPGQ